MTRNGDVSYWHAAIGLPQHRAVLQKDREADVAIVGAGFTGLWTAYHLKRARPELDIVVVERAFAGFGASGRNGGWLAADLNADRARVARECGRDAVESLERALRGAVDDVLATCAREGIDADIARCGALHIARGPAQLARLRAQLLDDRAWGLTEREVFEVGAAELAQRVRVGLAAGALFRPRAARVQPAKLVRGLADATERAGVAIYEGTTVENVAPGQVRTARGTVHASKVLICLEGFTSTIPGYRRTWLPLNSAMITTEPLSADVWAEIGWEGCELVGDAAHVYFYAQRTADGRIALGGRGVPYRFGSRTDHAGRTQLRTIADLTKILHSAFPPAASAAIEHAWCGVLGVPRDWTPTVRFDPATGVGIAGGYVGNGMPTSNLAGRTLCDLVLGEPTELTFLPWVDRMTRQWEPEPLRFIGAHLVYGLYRAADWREAGGLAHTSRLAYLASRIAGK